MVTSLRFLLIFIVFLVVGGVGGWLPATGALAQGAAPENAWDPAWPLAEEFVATFEGELAAHMPEYELEVKLDLERMALEGQLIVDFTNHTGKPIAELPFRLYPNAEYYGEGSLTVTALVVDGEEMEPELSVGDTVLTVPLGRLLAVERTTTIEMQFETIVPTNSEGSFGIFSHDAERQTWILADWYPIIAGWDDDSGWGVDPPTRWGDPTFAETSVYDIRLTVPAGMGVASSGTAEVVERESGTDIYVIESGPVREFAMVLDDAFQVEAADAEGVSVRLHLDGGEDDQGAAQVLEAAVVAVNAYADRYGPYPFDELDIVQTELAAALGVSWSGVIFMDAERMSAAVEADELLGGRFVFTLFHEIGHQWWGNLVGVNSNDHAFMNESLTNYLTTVAFADIYGEETGLAVLEGSLAAPYLAQLNDAGDGIVDLPIAEASSVTAYSRLIYGKGGLGFLAIRLEIGDDAFFRALGSYSQARAFGLATPEELKGAFEEMAGRSIGDLWRFWFDAAEATPADVEALLAAAYAA
jgi:hypothetical protein